MALKRYFEEEGDDCSQGLNRGPRQRLISASVFRDVMSGISLQEFVPRLEPFIRRVVQEEVNRGIQRFLHSSTRSSFDQIESFTPRAWQLQFQNPLPLTLFTSSRVESEDSEPIKIVLVDANSKEIVTTGPLSSIKLEIVVLDGDFVAGEAEDWTEKDFNTSIIREREGKRPLVTGDLTITLRNGVAELDNICFTDNSSWIRSRKFRIGARVQGISAEVRVREAKSEAFVVKDHRGESYKKHHPPSLGDEIWRLERIAKDGAFHKRLAIAGISTVEDFLRFYVTDPSSLHNVIGGGISKKTWDKIIEHATTCVLDDKMYMYTRATETVVLVFNSIWNVIGAIFDGQDYQTLDKLNVFKRRLVEDLKRQAYKNLDELVPINEQSFIDPPMLLSNLQAEPLSSHSAVGLQNVTTQFADEDQLQMQLGSDLPPYTFEVDNGTEVEVSLAHNAHSMQAFSPTLSNSFMMKDFCYGSYREGYSAAPSRPVVITNNLAANDISQVEMPTWEWNGIMSSDFGFGFSRNGKPKTRWFKIRAAIKWGISVRRDVAAKRMARLMYYDF